MKHSVVTLHHRSAPRYGLARGGVIGSGSVADRETFFFAKNEIKFTKTEHNLHSNSIVFLIVLDLTYKKWK